MNSFNQVLELTKNVNALLCEKDKKALYDFASEVKDGGIIVDIGTASGASAFIMALASKPKVLVYTIDPLENNSFDGNRKELGLEKKVVFCKATSKDAYEGNLELGVPAVDMLFIDGVHSYQGVKDDFETWGGLVNSGGIIAFHDTILYGNTIGTYVEEIVKAKKLKQARLVKDTWTDGRTIGLFVGRKP